MPLKKSRLPKSDCCPWHFWHIQKLFLFLKKLGASENDEDPQNDEVTQKFLSNSKVMNKPKNDEVLQKFLRLKRWVCEKTMSSQKWIGRSKVKIASVRRKIKPNDDLFCVLRKTSLVPVLSLFYYHFFHSCCLWHQKAKTSNILDELGYGVTNALSVFMNYETMRNFSNNPMLVVPGTLPE